MTGNCPRNLITDVAGLTVGQRHHAALASGVTVILTDAPAAAAVSVFGGGPGTRDLEAIGLEGSVGAADAIVLSGGSAFGLDAATGVQSFFREKGRGFKAGTACVPIVPQAILFDLMNGGDKAWTIHPPYRDMAYEAAKSAAANFDLGAAGAGFGATVAAGAGKPMRGGLGSASEVLRGLARDDGAVTVGAIAAVNAVGAVTVPGTPHFWASPFERGAEFGGLGSPNPWPTTTSEPAFKYAGSPGGNTTLCVVATDADLTQAQCKRLSTMAGAGMARAIVPVFTPFDGDVVFALSTGRKALRDPAQALAVIGAAAANCIARSIARGVFEACGTLPDGTLPYRSLFGAG
jgi:L-aminopeptidase/D-esterase-like protein